MCLSNAPQIEKIDSVISNSSLDLKQILDNDSFDILNDCNYLLPEDVHEIGNKFNIKIMHINAQSLVNKMDELKLIIEKCNSNGLRFDILLICETFISDYNKHLCELDDYVLFERHRNSKRGGGVAIYVHNSFVVEERSDLNIFIEGELESLFVEVKANNKQIILGELYRTPGSDLNSFLTNYESLLNNLCSENKMVVIGTDQNLDYLKVNMHKNTAKFLNMNLDSGLVPMITRPTRITHSSCTLIDNLYTNINVDIKSAILLSDFSDHLPCCLFVGRKRKKNSFD